MNWSLRPPHRHRFARSTLFSRSKFLIFGDDDVYFRVEGLRKLLGAYPDPEATAYAIHPDRSRAIYDHPECERSPSRHGQEWGLVSGYFQPAILSRAAVSLLADPSAHRALTRICDAYAVSHDVGLGVLFWQLELAVADVDRCASSGSTGTLKNKYVMVHEARVLPGWSKKPPSKAEPPRSFADLDQVYSNASAWSGCSQGRLYNLSGVGDTEWSRRADRGPFDVFGPEDCAREQNAILAARGQHPKTCWCSATRARHAWPRSDACRAECANLT